MRLDALESQVNPGSASATASVSQRGFEAKPADGAYSIRIRPRTQTD